MKKVCTSVVLLLVIMLVGCQQSGSREFFFETGHRVVGIDPAKFKIKTKVLFDTHVTYGDRAADGRIFVADEGSQVGQWGEQVFVLDRKKIIARLNVFPISRQMKVCGDRLVIGNSAYTAEGYAGLQIFDVGTYAKLYEAKDVGNIVLQRNIQAYQGCAYLAVPAFAAKNRKSYIMRIDLATMERTDLPDLTADHPFDRYDILINGDRLIVSFNESREIRAYDLASFELITSIQVADLVDIPESESRTDYWLTDPQMLQGKLVIFLTDNLPDVLYQKLLTFDPVTLRLEKMVDLDSRQNLRFFSCRYTDDTRLWVHNGEWIAVFEAEDGQLLKVWRVEADGAITNVEIR